MNLLFEGQLKSSPFHGEIFHSSFRQLELHTESDFAAFQQMAMSPQMHAIEHHRTAGLAGQLNIRTKPGAGF